MDARFALLAEVLQDEVFKIAAFHLIFIETRASIIAAEIVR